LVVKRTFWDKRNIVEFDVSGFLLCYIQVATE
jgi:hypothetical protein